MWLGTFDDLAVEVPVNECERAPPAFGLTGRARVYGMGSRAGMRPASMKAKTSEVLYRIVCPLLV